jgi:hypothetical protein
MRKICTAIGLAALLAAPGLGSAQTPPATPPAASPPAAAQPPAEHVRVDGFRNAKWGMTEAQVKAVLTSDFKIPADKLKSDENLNERTTVLTIALPDLIEGTGTARVSYIFGYTTKKLIQVNIVWGTAIDPQVKPEMVVAAANQLRQLFLESGYEPSTIVSNARAADGEIVVFEGRDADKHTTLLRLATAAPQPADKDKQNPAATTLFLSYILDSKNPDIFKLKRGQF